MTFTPARRRRLGIPARKAMPPPTHSRIAMRWVNWERSFR